jgi:hypothetical protein
MKEEDKALIYVLSLPNSEYLTYWVQDLIKNAFKEGYKIAQQEH